MEYDLTSVSGASHCPIFSVQVEIYILKKYVLDGFFDTIKLSKVKSKISIIAIIRKI